MWKYKFKVIHIHTYINTNKSIFAPCHRVACSGDVANESMATKIVESGKYYGVINGPTKELYYLDSTIFIVYYNKYYIVCSQLADNKLEVPIQICSWIRPTIGVFCAARLYSTFY